MYLRVSAGDGSYKVVSQPFQPIYEGGQKISFLGQIGDGILFCATQINEVRPFKEDAFRMKDTPFEFRLSIPDCDGRCIKTVGETPYINTAFSESSLKKVDRKLRDLSDCINTN